MKLHCTKCNYKFEKDKIPHRCPYCGYEGTIKEQLTAQDILDMVNREQKELDNR